MKEKVNLGSRPKQSLYVLTVPTAYVAVLTVPVGSLCPS